MKRSFPSRTQTRIRAGDFLRPGNTLQTFRFSGISYPQQTVGGGGNRFGNIVHGPVAEDEIGPAGMATAEGFVRVVVRRGIDQDIVLGTAQSPIDARSVFVRCLAGTGGTVSRASRSAGAEPGGGEIFHITDLRCHLADKNDIARSILDCPERLAAVGVKDTAGVIARKNLSRIIHTIAPGTGGVIGFGDGIMRSAGIRRTGVRRPQVSGFVIPTERRRVVVEIVAVIARTTQGADDRLDIGFVVRGQCVFRAGERTTPANGLKQSLLRIQTVIKGLLFHEGQDEYIPTPIRTRTTRFCAGRYVNISRRQFPDGIVVIVHGNADLLEMIRALHSACRFTGGLNGG